MNGNFKKYQAALAGRHNDTNKYIWKKPNVYWKAEGTCCSCMSINLNEIYNKISRLEGFDIQSRHWD